MSINDPDSWLVKHLFDRVQVLVLILVAIQLAVYLGTLGFVVWVVIKLLQYFGVV